MDCNDRNAQYIPLRYLLTDPFIIVINKSRPRSQQSDFDSDPIPIRFLSYYGLLTLVIFVVEFYFSPFFPVACQGNVFKLI